MALRWLEGFDWIDSSWSPFSSTTQDLFRRRYGSFNISHFEWATAATGRNGGTALQFGYGYSQGIRTMRLQDNLSNSTKVYTGFAYKMPDVNWASGRIFMEIWSGDNRQFTMYTDAADGTFQLRPSNGTSGMITTDQLRLGAWYYIEVYVDCQTSGEYEVRINGKSYSNTGVNCNSGYGYNEGWTSVAINNLGTVTANEDCKVDDWYVCSGDGTVNNNFLGDIKVVTLKPNGDDTTDWTTSSGTAHYALVNDTPLSGDVEDTNYVYEGKTAGNEDMFDYENLPSELASSSIIGVQANSFVKTTNEQLITFKQKVKSNSSEADGEDNPAMFNDYVNVIDHFETDPDTGSAWTPAGINTMKAGIEIVS